MNKDQTVLEMVTTKNDHNKDIMINYQPLVSRKGLSARLFIQCSDAKQNKWSYVLDGCTEFAYGENYFENIPNSKVKMWKITKSLSNVMISCNNVNVLNFNFVNDSIESVKESYKKWSRKPMAIGIASQFSEHTFVKLS